MEPSPIRPDTNVSQHTADMTSRARQSQNTFNPYQNGFDISSSVNSTPTHGHFLQTIPSGPYLGNGKALMHTFDSQNRVPIISNEQLNIDPEITYQEYIKDITRWRNPAEQPDVVEEPPDLAIWRDLFFNASTNPLIMSAEQFTTYYPHVDNIYSHRSTQYAKRKPYVHHYFHCRLKGRPSGKSASVNQGAPTKQTRKRKRRELELCQVKIKITEYFSQEERDKIEALARFERTEASGVEFGILERPEQYPAGHPGNSGQRWYCVGGVEISNSPRKEDSQVQDLDESSLMLATASSTHTHTLEDIDNIKLNSVLRKKRDEALKDKREARRLAKAAPEPVEVTAISFDQQESTEAAIDNPVDDRLRLTGLALVTSRQHRASSSSQLVFFANCLCPLSQTVWLALEHLGFDYQYVDNLSDSMEQSRGRQVPSLEHHGIIINGATRLILEYLEDIGAAFVPPRSIFTYSSADASTKFRSRKWASFIEERILPPFYVLIEVKIRVILPASKEIVITDLCDNIRALVDAADDAGPYFIGNEPSLVDLVLAPFFIRLMCFNTVATQIQTRLANASDDQLKRWNDWSSAVLDLRFVKRTMCSATSYKAVYNKDSMLKGLPVPEAEWAKDISERYLAVLRPT